MAGEQNAMVRKSTTVMVTATAFTCGLLFGLILHLDLPGVSSPLSHTRTHSRQLRTLSDETGPFPDIPDLEEIDGGGAGLEDLDWDSIPADTIRRIHADNNDSSSRGGAGVDSDVTSRDEPEDIGRRPLTEQARNLLGKHQQQTGPATATGHSDDISVVGQLKSEKDDSGGAYGPRANSDDHGDFAVHVSNQVSSGGETRSAFKSKIAEDKLRRSQHHPKIHKQDKIAAVSSTQVGDYAANNAAPLRDTEESSSSSKMAARGVPQSPQLADMVDGVYWSEHMELLTPRGFTDSDRTAWRDSALHAKIVAMEGGCGRMQNRLLVLESGARACARYRINTDQIQGEIYSYYLSRLLEIPNVPPSVLVRADMRDSRWRNVDRELVSAQWNPDKPVIMTPWLDNLTPSYIPKEFQGDERRLQPNSSSLLGKTPEEIGELVQWSDLIVFDYLTGNLDRVVNNMFNKQWNSQMMQSAAHNLERDSKTGKLVFLDNESGLFHSYRLLEKYADYHKSLLDSLCIFRRSTAENIEKLNTDSNVGSKLTELFRRDETFADYVPRMPQQNVKILQQRLADVSRQIEKCREIHTS